MKTRKYQRSKIAAKPSSFIISYIISSTHINRFCLSQRSFRFCVVFTTDRYQHKLNLPGVTWLVISCVNEEASLCLSFTKFLYALTLVSKLSFSWLKSRREQPECLQNLLALTQIEFYGCAINKTTLPLAYTEIDHDASVITPATYDRLVSSNNLKTDLHPISVLFEGECWSYKWGTSLNPMLKTFRVAQM